MESLVLLKRLEFAPIEGSAPYLRRADIYSDGEDQFVFLTFYHPGKGRIKDAVAKVTYYDAEKKPIQSFGVKLDIAALRPGREYEYPDPVPMPMQADGFNFEFLKFDGVAAPKPVDKVVDNTPAPRPAAPTVPVAPASPAAPVAAGVSAPVNVTTVAAKPEPEPEEVAPQEEKSTKKFVVGRPLPRWVLPIAIGATAVSVFFAFALSNIRPILAEGSGANGWRAGTHRSFDGVNYFLYSDGTVSAVSQAEYRDSIYIPEVVEGRPVVRIEKEAFRGTDARALYAPYVTFVDGYALADADFSTIEIGTGLYDTEELTISTSALVGNRLLTQFNTGGILNMEGTDTIRSDRYIEFNAGRVWYAPFHVFESPFTFRGTIEVGGGSTFVDTYVCEADIELSSNSMPVGFFENTQQLEHVDIHYRDRLYRINERAFANSAIQSYDFDNVGSIGRQAFTGCQKLSVVNIPENVSIIEAEAFFDCPNINEVYLSSNTTFSSSAFPTWTDIYVDGVLQTKGASTEATLLYEYNSDRGGYEVVGYEGSAWSQVIIPDLYDDLPVTSIKAYALQGIAASSISVGANVNYIGERAFANSSISDVVLYNGDVVDLEAGALRGAASLATFNAPEAALELNGRLADRRVAITCREISDDAASLTRGGTYDLNLTYCDESRLPIVMQAGVLSIEVANYANSVIPACADATSVTSIILRGGESVATEAFANSPKLDYFDFSYVQNIEEYAFRGCAFVNITFPQNVLYIAPYAFLDCDKLDYVSIPYSTTYSETSFRAETVINRY